MRRSRVFGRSGCARRGLTLVEVAVSAALVGLMLVASLHALGAVFRTRLTAQEYQRGEALARQLMAEIMANPYEDPEDPTFGRELGEYEATRRSFDDVDDYEGFSQSSPRNKVGNAIPGSAGWSWSADVFRVEPDAPLEAVPDETGLKLIEVTVTSPTGGETRCRSWRSSAGALEYRPPIDQAYVTEAEIEIQIGEGSETKGRRVLLNQVEAP